MKIFFHALVVSHISAGAKCSSDHFRDSCAEPLMQEGSAVVQAVQVQQGLDIGVGDDDIVTLDAGFARAAAAGIGPSTGPSGGPGGTPGPLVDLSNCVSEIDMSVCSAKVECKVIILPVLGATCAPKDPDAIVDQEGHAPSTSVPLLLQIGACTQAKQMALLEPSGEVKKVIRFPVNNTGYEAYFKVVEGGATKLVGKENGHGRIDLKCGSAADIEFGFVRSRTDIRVPMDHVALNFYDFQQGGQSVEACASRVFMNKNAQLAVNTNPECAKVSSCQSTKTREFADADDLQHRATFLWSGEQKLRFRLAADGCSDSSEKSFSFAFDPSAACDGALDVMSKSWRPRTCCDVGDCDQTLHVSKSTHR